MIIVGLTGSIGMGKSNAASALRRLGVPVFDSDAAVHRLLGPGGRAVRQVAAAFPDVQVGDHIDRKRLGARVFGDTPALRRLESIVHPMVRRANREFLAEARRRREPLVVLDIPLLYENGLERTVDRVIVVSAPKTIQRQRVLGRSGMTAERLAAILARQVPDLEKRRRADWVVRTGGHRGDTFRQLRRIVRRIEAGAMKPAKGRRKRRRKRRAPR
jgi:dephospho-CoA kinase